MPLVDAATRWKVLLNFGVWAVSLIGGFLLLPPYLGQDDAAALTRFAQFLAAGIGGLLLVPLAHWKDAKNTRWWWMVGALLLAGAVAAFFYYDGLRRRDTVRYDTTRVVVGSESEYLPEAKAYADSIRREGEPVTRETMVSDATGHLEWVWPEEVLRARESRLLYAYCLALGLLSSFILVVSQLVAAYVPKPAPE